MKIRVAIEKTLEDWWGIDDLLQDMSEASKEEQDQAIIELLREDLIAVIDDASWTIAREEE